MIKKILFYTLERFNLADANELQTGVLDKLKALTTLFKDNTAASDLQSGGIESPTISGVSGGVATFGPLKVLTSKNDIIELNATDVADGLTTCSVAAAYADFLSLNQSGLTPDGIYFYAYPIYENSDIENRDFYSIVDGDVVNQSIATRQRSRLNIFANVQSSYLVESGGERPIYLGYVPKNKLRGPTNDAGSTTTNASSPFLPSHFKPYTHFGKIFDANGNYDDEDGGIANEANDRHLTVSQNLQNIEPGNRAPLKLVFDKIKRNLDRIKSFGEDDPTDTDLLGPDERPKYSLQGLKKIIENEVSTINTTINNNLTESLSEVRLYYAVKKTSGNNYQITKWTDPNVVAFQLYNDYTSYAESVGAVPGTAINDMSSPDLKQKVLRHLAISLPPTYANKYIAGLSVTPIVNVYDGDIMNEYDLLKDITFNASTNFYAPINISLIRKLDIADFQANITTTKNAVSHPGSFTIKLQSHENLTITNGIEILLTPDRFFTAAPQFDIIFEIKVLFKEYV